MSISTSVSFSVGISSRFGVSRRFGFRINLAFLFFVRPLSGAIPHEHLRT